MKCILILSIVINIHAVAQNSTWLDTVLPVDERLIRDEFFQPEHTYTFFYDAQLATGIPGASKQHSGTRIQCLAELIFVSPTSCILQLSHIRVGRMNRKVPDPRRMMPFEVFEEVPLQDEVRSKLEMPVGFAYQDGVVNDVTFDGEEPPWCSNVVRGILNMLQVHLKTNGQLPTEEMKLVNVKFASGLEEHKTKQYRIVERTLEGQCESIYTMFNGTTNETVHKLVFTKSIDFDKCQMRPEVKYNFRFADSCPDCRRAERRGSEEYLKTTTLAKFNVKMNLAGNWILDKAQFESEHIFSPYDPQAGVAVSYINQTLTLMKSTGSVSTARPMQHPVKSEWGLMYALDFDIWKERFAMDGEEDRQLHFLRRMPYSDVKQQKRELVSGLMRALLAHMRMRSIDGRLDGEAPRHMLRLVDAYRMFMKDELDDLYGEFTSPDEGPWTADERKIIKDILPHVVAMCSTKECVLHLVEKIKDGSVPAMKASTALKCLLNDRAISEPKIFTLLDLAESDVVGQNFLLRQSLWLTIGSLMNGLCMPNQDTLARSFRDNLHTFCTRQLKENYVEILFNKFNNAQKWTDRILYMKTIGNAGIDLSIFNLEKIIRNLDGHTNSNDIRSEAILALRQLKHVMPRKVQKILLPITCNWLEHAQVRMTAAYQLLKTRPERAMLDQLARMLFREPNSQVASFIFTYMNTLAKSINPCEQRLVADLRFALRQANVPRSDRPGYSTTRYYGMYSQTYLSGLDMELGSLFTNTSFMPKYLTATFHANSMGFWYKYLFALGFVQDGLEPMVRDWIFGRSGVGSQENRAKRLVADVQNELNALFTQLGIAPRNPGPNQEPKLYADMKYLDQDYAMIPFILTDQQRQTNSADGIIDLKRMLEDLKNGITLNINEACLLAEISHKIPTTLGMQLIWSVKLPLMHSIHGRIQVTSSPNSGQWENTTVIMDLKPSLATTMLTKLEIWSPIVNSGLKIISKVKIHAPLDARLEIDRKSNPASVQLNFKLPTGKKDLLSMETRPLTLTRVWPPRALKSWNEPDMVSITSEDPNRNVQFKHCFGKQIFGVEICARGQFAKAVDLKKTAPRCPLIGPERILITSEAVDAAQTPTEISLKFSTKLYEKTDDQIRTSFDGWIQFPEDTDSSESAESSARNQYVIKKPWKHTVKMEIDTNGHRLINADFVHLYDPNHLYGKVDWKFQCPSTPMATVCLKGEILFPKPPYTIDDLRNFHEKKVKSSVKLVWGDQECQSQNFVKIQMQANQPESHMELHRNRSDHAMIDRCIGQHTMVNCSPILQYDHLVKASQLTNYRFMIEHRHIPPSLANLTLKAYDQFKYMLHTHSDIDQSINSNDHNGKIYANLILDPMNSRKADLLIRTSSEKARFTEIALPPFTPLINLKNTRRTLVDYVYGHGHRALCHVSKRKIKTYDEVEYSVPISTCWHVLSKDCASMKPRFVVLMRKISDDERKDLKILTSIHKVLISMKNDHSIEIEVNGRKFVPRIDERQEINGIKIIAMGPYVKLEFIQTKLNVYFDGYATNIKISRAYLSEQCGLCGHYDNEGMDAFRMPNFDLETDVRLFYKAWTLNEPSGCSVPEVESICTDPKCRYRPYLENGQGEDITSNEYQPLRKTRVIEIEADICFSTEPIDECSIDMYAIQKETRQVQFVCLERDDELAEQTLNRLRTETVINLNRRPTGIRSLDIPVKCATLN